MGLKYSTVTVSAYNASPPSDDGTQSDANKVKWATTKTKLSDPLNSAIASINTALLTAFDYSVNQKTAAYTTVAGDHMRTVEIAPTVSSAVTISLGDATTMTSGYMVLVKNSSGVTCTLTRVTGGDTIDGVAGTVSLPSNSGIVVKVNSGATGYLIVASYGVFPATAVFASATFSGNATVTGTSTAHSFQTTGTSVSVSNNTATSVLTLINGDRYYVTGSFAAANFHGEATVFGTAGGAVLISSAVSGSMTFTVSGNDLRVTQTQGTAQTFAWTAIQLA